MKIITQVAFAGALGVLAVFLTGHAHHATESSVMMAETAHIAADTITIGILFVTLYLHKEEREYPFIGQLGGVLLILAGAVGLGFGLGHLVVIVRGSPIPIKDPSELLLVGFATLLIVFTQIKLTEEVHHLLHGHSHGSKNASYFFGGGTKEHKTSKMVWHASHATRAELYSDLVHAGAGVLMGVVAFSFGDLIAVRCLDSFLSIALGLWMIWRGIVILADD